MREVWLPLGAFVALTTTVAARHEMWRDEVRAFSVATSAPSWSALATSLHQEGHPILWYAILRVAYAATHSPLVLPVVALLVGWIAAWLVLRFAPFPFWVRLLTVFGVFLGYEYSVVARNYGIGAALMIVACVTYSVRHRRPIPLALALALLANTSVHAAFASLIIALVWLADIFRPASRSAILRPMSVVSFAIVLAGIAFALMTARASTDMVWALKPGQLGVERLARSLFADPGRTLMGTMQSGITSGAFPWARLGIDPDVLSRILGDVAILSFAWALRKNIVCLAAMAFAVFGFQIIFRLIYPGALRHEGILLFLFLSLAWIVYSSPSSTGGDRRALTLGLLPLLIAQTVALPIVALRDFRRPESSSMAFGTLIRNSARYRDAILMGEPDYMMESMPYYVPNRVYMPRQGEFQYRVYFDHGVHRRLDFHLATLTALADSLSCAMGRPALLAIAYPHLLTDTAGEAHPFYPGTVFRWNSAERARLLERGRLISSFTGAITDENYNVFEIAPPADSVCRGERRK